MKTFLVLVALIASNVLAAEPVVCSITTTAASIPTSTPTTGTCSWPAMSTVLVSCDQDIYLDSTNTGTAASPVVPTASSVDQKLVFVSNQDPVPVYLEPKDKIISVIWVTTAGTCKFMPAGTRRPRQSK